MTWVDPQTGAVFTHNPNVDPETCAHEWEPYSSETIVVSDEEFASNPLGNWTPLQYVDCKKCGCVINRGRYSRVISIPALLPDFEGEEEE